MVVDSFVNEAPRALIAKTKATNHNNMRQHFQRYYILASCLGTDGRVGAFSLKPPLLSYATLFAN